jgi:hypothetical protein
VDLLALTEEQVLGNKLPVIKEFDNRTKSYHDAVEIEALVRARSSRSCATGSTGTCAHTDTPRSTACAQRERDEQKAARDLLTEDES